VTIAPTDSIDQREHAHFQQHKRGCLREQLAPTSRAQPPTISRSSILLALSKSKDPIRPAVPMPAISNSRIPLDCFYSLTQELLTRGTQTSKTPGNNIQPAIRFNSSFAIPSPSSSPREAPLPTAFFYSPLDNISFTSTYTASAGNSIVKAPELAQGRGGHG